MPFAMPGFVDADSVQGAGKVSAPGANAAVVAAITPGAGTWMVRVACGTTGGAPVLADVANMEIRKTGASLAVLANPVSGWALMPWIRVTLAAADTLSVNAIGAATASVIYGAMLVAVKVA